MKILLLIVIVIIALRVAFHPRWGRIVNRSSWPWYRIAYLAILGAVATAALALWCMGWWA